MQIIFPFIAVKFNMLQIINSFNKYFSGSFWT